MSLVSRNLKEEIYGDCFVSLGMLFHALIVDGKKDLEYKLVQAWRVYVISVP